MNSAKVLVVLGWLCCLALVQFCADDVVASSPAMQRLRKMRQQQQAGEQMVADMQFGEAPPESEWETETDINEQPAASADASGSSSEPVLVPSSVAASGAEPRGPESVPEHDTEEFEKRDQLQQQQLQQQLPEQSQEQPLQEQSQEQPLQESPEEALPAALLEQHSAAGSTWVDRYACPANRANCLKVLSFNIYMRPTTLFVNYQSHRAGNIPSHIAPLAADVICFQEAFDDEIRQKVVTGMKNVGYPHATRVVGHDVGFEQDGGAMIVSKHAIENPPGEQRIYADCSGDDCMGMKGVIYARINKAGTRYHVFCSHLQAMDGDHHRSVRSKQFQTIKNFINAKNIPANELVVIAGDMNVNLYTAEVLSMKALLNAEFTMPDGCKTSGSYYYSWRGTAPFCDANSADCTLNGCDYVQSHTSGDGSKCWSGQKVQCKCPSHSNCAVYTWDAPKNNWAGGTSREWLDYVMWSKAHKHPLCHTMRVRGDIEFSDHYPVESVLYVGGTCGHEVGGGSAPPPPPQYQYKWVGTAPFCEGKSSDCNNGWTFVKSDKCGDGSCCWSGVKVQCRKQTN